MSVCQSRAQTLAQLDPCLVETPPLCVLVKEFVEEWLKTRRSRKGQGDYGRNAPDPDYVEPLGPYAWLSFDTLVPELALRKIRNPRRYPLVELRIVDAVVASIGEPMMFYDGTLTILRNPLLEPRLTSECCGGSTRTTVSYAVTSGAIISAPPSTWLERTP